MQPPLTDQKLAELYPHITPQERVELEKWHRGWIHNMMFGQATQEEQDAAIPPHPDPHHSEK